MTAPDATTPCAPTTWSRPTRPAAASRRSARSTASASTCEPGTVFALLGPNGAGKSTTVQDPRPRCRGPTRGTARRRRHRRAAADPDAVRRAHRPGLAEVVRRPDGHRAREPRARRPHPGPVAADARARADELLARFGLDDAADRLVQDLVRRHGPQARRRHRARPPPAGAVPRRADHRARPRGARRACGREIGRLAAEEQVTVLLTTHYLDEADRLAHRLAIVDAGRVVVEGTPERAQARAARRHRAGRARTDAAARAARGAALDRVRGSPTCGATGARCARAPTVGRRAPCPAVLAALAPRTLAVVSATVAPAVAGRRLPAPRRSHASSRCAEVAA